MRTCYFIQSHRDPEQVARLVATLRRSSPSSFLLVGHDARRCSLARADLPDLADLGLFHPPPPIERGRLSLLSPYFQALDWLAREGVDYDWLVYLSGQDYPTGPLSRAEAYLAASGCDGFLTWWDAFAPDNPWGRRRQGVYRYAYRYREAPRLVAPVLRACRFVNRIQSRVHIHLTYGALVGVRAPRTPFGPERTCYAGSQWTTLSRPCAEFLAEAVRRERELVAHFERTICSDESLAQTLLVNARRFRLHNDNLRYIDSRGTRDGSPRTLTCDDLPALADPRYHFARKFDRGVDASVLAGLDQRIFGPGDAPREATAAAVG